MHTFVAPVSVFDQVLEQFIFILICPLKKIKINLASKSLKTFEVFLKQFKISSFSFQVHEINAWDSEVPWNKCFFFLLDCHQGLYF